MESYINMFLKAELTPIPGFFDKYFGNYYNNALCNGATWMFVIWVLLHVFFEDLLNALLRKMRYKQYIRHRLQRSLWYLGFYTTACVYCIATVHRNNLRLVNFEDPFDRTNSPSGHLILGFIVLLTFYLQSIFWERLKYNNGRLSCNYLCLSLLMCFSYFLRFVEGIFRLTIFICWTQVGLELARCTALVKPGKPKTAVFKCVMFTTSLVMYIVSYLVVVPCFFMAPIIKRLTFDRLDTGITLVLCLGIWLVLDVCSSAPVKLIWHWIFHPVVFNQYSCERDFFECALFPPRLDATYTYQILRSEMQERERQRINLRRPRSKNVVFQTLKCMVAIKRKLHESRRNHIKEDKIFEENVADSDVATEEVVGGRLEFNINDGAKCKQE